MTDTTTEEPKIDFIRYEELTDYQAERKERNDRRAEKLNAAGDAQLQAAHDHVAMIPMGQPILVGHHSERRHRRDLERHDKKMRKGFELKAAAKRIAAIDAGRAIMSDDPDALDALRAQLAVAEANHEILKAANSTWRKGFKKGGRQGGIDALKAAGFADRLILQAVRAIDVMPIWKVPFHSSNHGAEMRRLRERIAEMEARAAEPENAPIEGDGFVIEESKEDNRIRFVFGFRPSREVAQKMKKAGFRWSPRAGAWQRHLNDNGRRAARKMARELFGWSEPEAAE